MSAALAFVLLGWLVGVAWSVLAIVVRALVVSPSLVVEATLVARRGRRPWGTSVAGAGGPRRRRSGGPS